MEIDEALANKEMEILRCPDSIDGLECDLDSRFQPRTRDVLFCCEPSRTLHSCILKHTIPRETGSNLSDPTPTYLVNSWVYGWRMR